MAREAQTTAIHKQVGTDETFITERNEKPRHPGPPKDSATISAAAGAILATRPTLQNDKQTVWWAGRSRHSLEATKLMKAVRGIPLGDIIAERLLKATKEGKSYVVTVRVGRPVKFKDAHGYQCPYQIFGIGDDVVRSSAGEDSMQALELAIKMLGAELYLRYKDFTFTWLGQADLGFPKPNI